MVEGIAAWGKQDRFAAPPWTRESEEWQALDRRLPPDHLARGSNAAGWTLYGRWLRDCWQGRVADVIANLCSWQEQQPDVPTGSRPPPTDPRRGGSQDTHLLGKQPDTHGVSTLSLPGDSVHVGLDGVVGQGIQLPGQRQREILERRSKRGSDSSSTCRRAVRGRPLGQASGPAFRQSLPPPPRSTRWRRKLGKMGGVTQITKCVLDPRSYTGYGPI